MESRLAQRIRKHYADDRSIFLWKIYTGPLSGTTGIPDMGVLSHGRAMFLELKTGKAKATPLQLAVMRTIANQGGCPCVVARTLGEAIEAIELWRTEYVVKGMSGALDVLSDGEWIWPNSGKAIA